MLWQRILTALCLIPLVLWAVIGLNSFYFSSLALIVFAWGALEWAGLGLFESRIEKAGYVLCFILLSVLIGWCDCKSILFLGALFWCLPAYWILTYQESSPPMLLQSKWGKALIGIITLSTAWYSLCAIQKLNLGSLWIILLFALVWGSDTFAYFAGRLWGKTPLALTISPKKTLAGFWGGLIGTLFGALLIFIVLKQVITQSPLMPYSAWVSIAYITILLCVLGDLFESLVKRLSGVKDSGRLLPGHGGLLDRIDSLLAALPFYASSLVWVMK